MHVWNSSKRSKYKTGARFELKTHGPKPITLSLSELSCASNTISTLFVLSTLKYTIKKIWYWDYIHCSFRKKFVILEVSHTIWEVGYKYAYGCANCLTILDWWIERMTAWLIGWCFKLKGQFADRLIGFKDRILFIEKFCWIVRTKMKYR